MNDELLVKFMLRETSPEEDLLVDTWISADPVNKKHYSQFELLWEASKKTAATSTLDEEAAWLRFKDKVSASAKQEPIVRPLQRFNWLKIAAILLIIPAAWSLYFFLNQLNYTTLSANKQVRTEILPDGSEVTLNNNSVISYPNKFDSKQRKIQLEKGDVFFNITPDKAKPFIIEIDKVTVRVVGTSFNIKHLNNQTEVIVETGIVRVSVGSQNIELHPGEKVLVKNDSEKLVVEENTDQLYKYYRTKMFVANSTPLWRVVDILNEAYEANIVIEDSRLRNLTLTTTFKEETLDHILQIISDTFNINVVKADQKIILTSKR